MRPMSWWETVEQQGMTPPPGRSLSALSAELGALLGDPDPRTRRTAYRVLATWVGDGVYDHLLERLGTGVSRLLTDGLGEVATDSVFGRSQAALVLAEIIRRDNEAHLLTARTMRGWGESLAEWYLAERDLRGFVTGRGWARPLAHGADAIGQLADSRHLGRLGLIYLLDLLAERLLLPTGEFLVAGETDRMAAAAMAVVRRRVVDRASLEEWVARLAARSQPRVNGEFHPYLVAHNVQAFLRALYLQLALSPDRSRVGSDLQIALVGHLRETNARYLPPIETPAETLASEEPLPR